MPPSLRPWSDLLALVDLVAPAGCAGCGRPSLSWCGDCAAALRVPPRAWSPTPPPPGMPPTWAGPEYAGVVRTTVVAWKDGGRHDLTDVLAPVLARSLATALRDGPEHAAALRHRGSVLVVPAPSSAAGTRARGWSPVTDLARAAVPPGVAQTLPLRPVLRVTRRVADQAGLGAQERRRNLHGAIAVRAADHSALQGVPCVLVDDVVTSGATLAECARALREAGSGPVVGAVVAATARRD